jgi:hypothetical protein
MQLQKVLVDAAGIRLAGATSDVHIMDVRTGKWERANVQGEPPSPRAAHAAAAVGSMVVVQVGLASDAGVLLFILSALLVQGISRYNDIAVCRVASGRLV